MTKTSPISRRGTIFALAAIAAAIPWANVAQAADGKLYVIAELVARDGQEATLRAALISAAKAAPSEVGCISYELLQDRAKPGRFLTYETWTDAAALTAHLTSPQMKAAAPMLAKILAQPFAITKLQRLI